MVILWYAWLWAKFWQCSLFPCITWSEYQFFIPELHSSELTFYLAFFMGCATFSYMFNSLFLGWTTLSKMLTLRFPRIIDGELTADLDFPKMNVIPCIKCIHTYIHTQYIQMNHIHTIYKNTSMYSDHAYMNHTYANVYIYIYRLWCIWNTSTRGRCSPYAHTAGNIWGAGRGKLAGKWRGDDTIVGRMLGGAPSLPSVSRACPVWQGVCVCVCE